MKPEQKKIDNKLEEEIKKLQEKADELTNGWKRTQADFDNYRKKMDLLKVQWISEANLDLILKIIPVMDNFERAAKHIPGNIKDLDWVKGVQLIEKHLQDIMIQQGLTKIESKPGDQFNPLIHEAISCEKNEDHKENEVIETVESGYMLGEKVVKPAKVRVCQG